MESESDQDTKIEMTHLVVDGGATVQKPEVKPPTPENENVTQSLTLPSPHSSYGSTLGSNYSLLPEQSTANLLKIDLERTISRHTGEERDTWDSRAEFLLSLIGYAVGLGNVWRFPYLTQKNGGGAFLIPYAVMILVEGVPLFYLELAVGQRLRKGAVGAWNQVSTYLGDLGIASAVVSFNLAMYYTTIMAWCLLYLVQSFQDPVVSPYLGGLGIASAVVSFNLALYYNTIMAWCLLYLVQSFQDPLPWSVCPSVQHGNETVIDDECQRSGPTAYFWYRETLQIAPSIESSPGFNLKLAAALLVAWLLVYLCMIKGIKSSGKLLPLISKRIGPIAYFWYRETLQIVPSIESSPGFNLKLAAADLVAWLLVYLCMIKSIKSSDNVVYVTATFPYLVLVIFFFRGITLKGSLRGLEYLFIPEWERLLDPAVWLDAATQIFYSFGLAFGCLIALASYNPVRSNFVQEAMTVSIADFFTSIFTAVVVFSILGFKATVAYEECLERHDNHTKQFGQKVEPLNASCNFKEFLEGSASGTGLAFIVFTEAINQFPVAQLWSALFFLMLLALGLDSMFGTLEGALTSVNDMMVVPGVRKEILVGITCLVSFLVSLAFAAETGPYVFDLYDSYCANIPLLIIAFCECVAISYKYGLKNISDDVELMVGHRPSYLWLVCWRYLGPLAMSAILIASILEIINNGSMYKVWDSMKGVSVLVPWPWWCQVLAGCLILMSVAWIPAVALCKYFRWVEWKEEIPAFFPADELKEEKQFKPKDPNWFERHILGFKT